MQAVSRFGPRGEGGGANFVAGTAMNIVQRSRYGRRAAQNMTRDVRPARNLVNTARMFVRFQLLQTCHLILRNFVVDPEIKKRIDTRIAEARNALKELEAEAGELGNEELAIKAVDNEFKRKTVSIELLSLFYHSNIACLGRHCC